MPPQLTGARVAGLIDQSTGTWDYHLLTNIFQPDDVPRILKLPISRDYEDIWYWYGDPNGCYSVKDGYRCIVGDYEINNNGTFNKWLTLWKIKIPPKWKTFLWRALSDILPTTNNLLIKRVEVNPMCAMCGISNEDTMHSLVLYTNGIIYAAAILYHIWRARNGAVWDACLPRPKKVLAIATATMQAWRAVHHRTTAHTAAEHTAQAAAVSVEHPLLAVHIVHAATALTAEQPPSPPSLQPHQSYVAATRPKKCYVDVEYHHGVNSATVGAILLDVDNQYISAFSALLLNCFSLLMAEAFAYREALSWLRARGEQTVQVHTYCQTL
ncbi:PREDICTED: uncharacterized protein LOC109153922 [Ipomoea nil]|uniref:uncharacterized protein LOC109153922 n=1 Tax=Ipomoea nil TaxID=35883 RepID=UPI000901074C|nr:PREDICTED: uncharacterized protein LOC109153922 [Ipomoea nil]